MKHAMALLLLLPALAVGTPARADETCTIDLVSKSGLPAGAWLNADNWLTPEYLRAGLHAPGSFMARKKIDGLPAAQPLKRAGQVLDLAKTTTNDPLDQSTRSLSFLLTTRLAPSVLLGYLHAIEARHGRAARTADQPRWQDRTLDLDLIAYGDVQSTDPALLVPHPRAAERDFVLEPWLAVDRDAVPGPQREPRLFQGEQFFGTDVDGDLLVVLDPSGRARAVGRFGGAEQLLRAGKGYAPGHRCSTSRASMR